MDHKTLVKRRWSYKVRINVYIQTLGEFARHEFTNLWLEALPDTPSLAKKIDTPLNQDSKGKLEETFLCASFFVKAHKSLYKIQDRFREKLMFSKARLRDSHLLIRPPITATVLNANLFLFFFLFFIFFFYWHTL